MKGAKHEAVWGVGEAPQPESPQSLLKLMSTDAIGDAIQSSHTLSPPSLALSLSQHQGLFQ